MTVLTALFLTYQSLILGYIGGYARKRHDLAKQRREIDRLKLLISPFDRDGDGRPGGSR